MLNFETIGGKIIEGHLRFADQWPDLYGKGFVDEVVKLYADRSFKLDSSLSSGYSVVLFSDPKVYKKPSKQTLQKCLVLQGISSIQFPFHENQDPKNHSMPPGGMRIAIVNGFDLDKCMEVRRIIKKIMVDCEEE